jgi:hypothetical protein
MKLLVVSLGVVLLNALPCHAIKVTLFTDTGTFVRRAKDIVIAKCLGPVPEGGKYAEGLYPVDVEVVSILKAARKEGKGGFAKKPGKGKIATIYPMTAGKTYLLTSLGGSAYGTDFLAIPELAVVELPPHFRLGALKGKTVVEQVRIIFSARRQEIARQRRLLEQEKKLLDKAVSQ